MPRNRVCPQCGDELRTADTAVNYCGDDCKILYHRRITMPFEQRLQAMTTRRHQPQRPRGEAALLADRASGSRNTTSVTAGWSALGNEAGTYSPYYDRYSPERGNLPHNI